ncbi:hypothetical protein A2617_03290 [Candidatus Daviesbacteria bacterium RIFOXYD1_FULL_41_10]|uniref:Uncharacterized protein n=2 Tax=Candidatus Daviesiibacteriota TaxID=1752718 RepID=A0A1F5MZ89_9BACT|nr:MAG: Cytochrome c biogenesis protein transmembrane region [Candidatus Daviesbacteria bacterium GW2011_GWB1_41_5]OGE70550.1 MAG: hypothetical protein A2617_03290 [Candidatus Daviesbacteria bacterium RIFOXYD1_FULL_41_10]HCQ93417.1 cytochrome C biogenesis protein [Candidatus Beckwithbacteria bacterium]
METILFQTSLIAAFVAGMVALFAPCCITFLLPAYLGSVFKEKEKVLLMTLVFGLGIFVVLLPAVLGVAFISKSLFRYHNEIYLISGVFMLLIAGVSLLGLKMPMPHFSRSQPGVKTDVLSIFTMGIFSGITSACCAPVLIGIMALTFLTPSFFGAIILGGMYVLGMVTPLLIISAFLSGKMPKFTVLRRPLGEIKIFGKTYPLILNNLIAAAIFFITGSLTLILTVNGRLSMEGMSGATKTIENVGGFINSLLGGNIVVNGIFLLAVIYFLYWISRKT